jgi:Domain of unknown function (DUF397)
MEGTDLNWRKSSYSGNGGGECVEVGKAGHVLIRDTKDHGQGPVLRFSPDAWQRFADKVKRSLADLRAKRQKGHPRVLRVSLRPIRESRTCAARLRILQSHRDRLQVGPGG